MNGFMYFPCEAGGHLLKCTFSSGSNGCGCLVDIPGQEVVEIERNGTVGSKTVILSPGEFEFSVYDWDNHEKFGPVVVKDYSVPLCDGGEWVDISVNALINLIYFLRLN